MGHVHGLVRGEGLGMGHVHSLVRGEGLGMGVRDGG